MRTVEFEYPSALIFRTRGKRRPGESCGVERLLALASMIEASLGLRPCEAFARRRRTDDGC